MALDILKNIDVVRGNFSSSITGSIDTKHEEISPLSTQNISIDQGLDFILAHLHQPIWPRTIFTKTIGKQYTVYSKEEALARFKQSNLLDCRINAYPDYTGFKGINRQAPNFIFIDIDRCLFTTDKELWGAVEETCKNIEQTLGGKPTVLWSGNGVHICQPVEAVVLEQQSKFALFDQPSQTFLKFAAQFVSNHRSDTAALNIINGWSKCGKLRQLDQSFDYMVRYALKYSAKNWNRPLKLDTLKPKNRMLYEMLK